MKAYQRTQTRAIVAKMAANGCTVVEIAKACDVTRARIYQHLKKLGMTTSPSTNVMPRKLP